MDPEKLYLEHRPFIEDSLATICERHHVSLADRDDLVSTVQRVYPRLEGHFAFLAPARDQPDPASYVVSAFAGGQWPLPAANQQTGAERLPGAPQ